MNQHSIRSHAIVRLWIESTGIGMANGEKNGSTQLSSLSLVDLTGSEDLRQQLADAKEQHNLLQEATVAPPTAMEAADGEVKELVDGIKMTELLIVQNKPHQASLSASDLVDDDEFDLDLLLDGDNDDEGKDEDLLNDVPSHTLLP
jgi:hypothetical protein